LHLLTVGTLEDERVRAAASSVTEIPKPAVFRPRRRTTQRLFTLALLLLSREPGTTYPARGPRKLLARRLRSISNGFDIVLVEHEALAPLLPRSRRGVWIVTFHHLLSAMHATEAARSFTRRQRWLWRRERQKALRLERRAIRGYDVAIACSSEDAGTLANMRATSQSADITTVPNGVDVEAISPTPIPLPPRLL
jgi:glycosyltransferase involved in cell wall biosynthesis